MNDGHVSFLGLVIKLRAIADLIDDIDSVDQKIYDIWFNRKKFSTKHEDKLRDKIRPLHLLHESLFLQLWGMIRTDKLEFARLEEIDRKKVFNGKKEVTRITYCDAIFHYIVNKKGNFQYGYACTCDYL